MDLNSRVDHMDEELKLLKNEIKQVLLEIQEHILNAQNPFVGAPAGFAGGAAPPPQQAVSQPPPAGSGGGGAPTVIVDTSTKDGGGGSTPAPTGGMGDSFPGFHSMETSGHNEFTEAGSAGLSPTASPSEPESPPESPPKSNRRGSGEPASNEASGDFDDFEGGEYPRHPASAAPQRGRRPARRPMRRPANDARAAGREDAEEYLDDYETEFSEETGEGGPRKKRPQDVAFLDEIGKQRVTDLVTLAGLAQWSQSALRKVGKDHLLSLLEVSELTGRISKETRSVLVAIIPLLESNTSEGGVSAKEIISLLAQLDGFLGTTSSKDTKLLPFLLQDDLEVFPLIRP